MKKTIIIVLSGMLFILTGCYDNPIDKEQYFKQVYIVGAADMLYTSNIYYSDTIQTSFVSVATGGSKTIDKDIQVTLVEADSVNIQLYNKQYVADGATRYQKLSSSSYTIPSMNVSVKAGDIYGRMPININTNGLSCDSLYTIPFKIAKSSEYPINLEDTVLLFSIKLINRFSGTYQATGNKVIWINSAASGLPSTLSATRVLTAVNKNTVRFFNWSAAETTTNRATQCLLLTINSDNSLSVKGWNQFVIKQGGGTYNPTKKLFNIWYLYMDGATQYRVDETLTM